MLLMESYPKEECYRLPSISSTPIKWYKLDTGIFPAMSAHLLTKSSVYTRKHSNFNIKSFLKTRGIPNDWENT